MTKDSLSCATVVSRGSAVVAAVALVGPVAAWSRPLTIDLGPTGLWLDRPGSLVVVLITGVAAIVTSYARRSLRGEEYAPRFFALAALVATASVVVATAATLALLVTAWLAVSAGVVGLIGLTGTPPARAAARRARRTFLVGDLALVTAASVAILTWGDLSLSDPGRLDGAAALGLVGLLVVVAAGTRSAQVPAHGWLVDTVWAPTPVSALLHAGVVNAGGILLIRLWPVVGATTAITYLLVVLGTATLVVGTLQARSRGDAKGALASSTVAQMGFTTLAVGFGAHPAAWLHLIAHGAFKASLFLGSGSAVAGARRARLHPRPIARPSAAWRAFAVAVPLAAVSGAGWAAASGHLGAGDLLVLAVLVAAAVAVGTSTLHRTRTGVLRVAVVTGAAAAASAYVVAAHSAGVALARDLPATGGSLPDVAWLGLVAVGLGAAAVVVRGRGARLRPARTALYAATVLPRLHEGPSSSPAPPPGRPGRATVAGERAGRTRGAPSRPTSEPVPSTPQPVGAPS